MPNYEVWLTNDKGARLAQLTTFKGMEASRITNGIGFCNVMMPASFDVGLIRSDNMIQVWRQPQAGSLALWRVYFLRKWSFSTIDGREVVNIGGPCTNDLLRRRIVAAYSGSTAASKTDFADDMMKEVVTQSEADGVAPTPTAGTRVWTNLTVQGDVSAGPTITKAFAFDKLLDSSGSGVLGDLAQASREAGTEVFFDVAPNVVTGKTITFIFQTRTGQPGQDVSSKVIFDQQSGNMRDPVLEYDYSEEVNYVYAGGKGEGSARNIQQVYDTVRYGASIWNRCEGFADARNQSEDNGVREAGRAALEQGRPRIRFTATPIDTDGTCFSRDWNFGDRVTAKYRGFEFNTIVRAVVLSVDEQGKESIQARLDFEALIT